MNITDLSVSDLRRAAQIKEQIDALTSQLASLLGNPGGAVSLNPQPLPPKAGGRRMSAAGRARIAAAARARWAKLRAAKGGSPAAATAKPGRRKMSAAGRAKIAAAARARWAKAKAAGKTSL